MAEQRAVAVLGANGFVGNRLVEWLVLHDLATVRPIVRSFTAMARPARFKLDVRIADATNQLALQRAIDGCDVLFHCVVGGRETILGSAEAAYRAAAAAGVRRLVYLSSAVVHGHDPAPGTNDASELLVEQPFEYNVSKAMAELVLRRLRSDGKVEVVTLRPSVVFGPRSTYWTGQTAADLLAGRAYLVDGGSGVCNSVFVDNLANALWLAATVPDAANQDFLIKDDEARTWRDLYAAVAQAVGVDISAVLNVDSSDAVRVFRSKERIRRLERLKPLKHFIGRSLARFVPPARLKQLVSDRIKQVVVGAPAPTMSIALDPEIVSLQSCRYQLPIDKARRVLGYDPPVGFAEASARTASWIRFAFALES